MDPGGTKELELPNPVIERCLGRHSADYARLSATPGEFNAFAAAVGQMMATEPNYTASQLSTITRPVAIVHSEHDEFIKLEHAQYLANTIPGAKLVLLPGVSHFAPLQRPAQFNRVMGEFLAEVLPERARDASRATLP
jgi:pimeloyl-ACP methyl ester carboxylesterase